MKKFLSGILLVSFFCVSTASFAEVSAEEYFDVESPAQFQLSQFRDTLQKEGIDIKRMFVVSKSAEIDISSTIGYLKGMFLTQDSRSMLGALDYDDQCFILKETGVSSCTQEQTEIVLALNERLKKTTRRAGYLLLGLGGVSLVIGSPAVLPIMLGSIVLQLKSLAHDINVTGSISQYISQSFEHYPIETVAAGVAIVGAGIFVASAFAPSVFLAGALTMGAGTVVANAGQMGVNANPTPLHKIFFNE